MKSTLLRVSLAIVFVVGMLSGVSMTTASAQQGACRKACQEAFRKARQDCKSATTRPDRRRCEAKAVKAHRECVKACRPA
jgi:hypothetical protein